MIISDQRRMLNSILDRYGDKIVIDRLVVDKEGDKILLNDEVEVKNHVAEYFENQYSSRKIKVEKMDNKWKEQYSPIEDIDRNWYKELTEEISEQEWLEAMKKTKNNSAPGASGITYPVLKKVGKKTNKILRTFAIMCIRSGKIPKEWKKGLLYAIPKNEFWNYNLNNICPIMLLETLQKTTVRIINGRMSKTIKDKGVLKGINFAGLPRDSTSTPIQIMNNIIEEVREKGKELWVLLQDMKKAFDSVSLFMLKLAMERIKIPLRVIEFLLD